MNNQIYDVGILTVVEPELKAVQRALKINNFRDRVPHKGLLYWHGKIYSQIHQRDLRVIVSCQALAGESQASTAASYMIAEFDPAMVILVGIAAGRRGQIRIGDVALSREVADVTAGVMEGGERKPRLLVVSLPVPVAQMVQSSEVSAKQLAREAGKLFGNSGLTVPAGKEKEYAKFVTQKPDVKECAVYSSDLLLRDAGVLEQAAAGLHQGIKVGEMEAAGFIKACVARYPSVLWLVIRGVSDFGDRFKNDHFHRLGSSSAAAYLKCFLEGGVDLRVVRPDQPPDQGGSSVPGGTPPAPVGPAGAALNNLGVGIINERLELFAGQINRDTADKIVAIRGAFREGRVEDGKRQMAALKAPEGWSVLKPEVKAEILLFEARTLLNEEGGTEEARKLADQARELAPAADQSVVRALVAKESSGINEALALLASSTTLEAWNVRLALLREADDRAGAHELFLHPPTGVTPDAESHRLEALACVFDGQLDVARTHVEQAQKLSPQAFAVKVATAIVNFAAVFVPELLAKIMRSPFSPVPDAYLLRTEDTLTSLRTARSQFSDLAKLASPKPTHQEELDYWHLATLAYDPEAQAAAKTRCLELEGKYPESAVPALWAAARGYVDDLETLVAPLWQKALGDQPSKGLLTVLFSLLAMKGDDQRLLEITERVEAQFGEWKEEDLWRFWRAQALLGGERFPEAMALAEKLSDETTALQVKSLILRAQATATGQWAPWYEFQEQCFAQTHDPEDLFELCEAKLVAGEADYVAERADLLLEKMPTVSALRLALQSIHQKDPGRCLQLLQTHRHLFLGKHLPPEWRRMQIDWQMQSGQYDRAQSSAETLAQETDAIRDHFAAFQIQVMTGALRRAHETAWGFVSRKDVPTAMLLHAAEVVGMRDAELAKKLYEKALHAGLSDPNAVMKAFTLAFQLGLEEHLPQLHSQVREIADGDSGLIQTKTLRELRPILVERAKYTQRLNESLARCLAPMHLVADAANVPLSHFFRTLPVANRQSAEGQSLSQRPAIFFHHAGRQRPLPTEPGSRLCLDLSAFLLAADLEILDEVEAEFKPLLIPPSLPGALIAQIAANRQVQNSRVKTAKSIVARLQADKLHVFDPPATNGASPISARYASTMEADWVALLEQAHTTGGYVLDYLPPKVNDPDMLPVTLAAEDAPRVIGCVDILDALHGVGRLSKHRWETAKSNLGTGAPDHPRPSAALAAKAPIYAHGNVIESLEQAGVLPEACEYFSIFIQRWQERDVRERLEQADDSGERDAWLQRLADRLEFGRAQGIYEFASVRPANAAAQQAVAGPASPENSATLIDLMRLDPNQSCLAWIDDRFVNQYGQCGSHLVVTCSEVLQALRVRGRITENDLFRRLHSLRSGNYRHLVPGEEEVAFWLREAPVQGGQLVETPELAVLRRYLASCLSQHQYLRLLPLPDGSPVPQGEVAFLQNAAALAIKAIGEIWSDTTILAETAQMRADWVMTNLWLGLPWLVASVKCEKTPKQRGEELTGASVAALFIKGLTIRSRGVGAEADGSSRRKQYFDWLDGVGVLDDEACLTAAAAEIRKVFLDRDVRRQFPGIPDELHRAWLHYFYLDLPERLQQAVSLDKKVKERIGVGNTTTLSFGPRPISVLDLGRAAEKAAHGKPTSIKALDTGESFRVGFESKELAPPVVTLLPEPPGVNRYTLRDKLLCVFLPDAKARRRALAALRRLFDPLDDAGFDRRLTKICAVRDAGERFLQVSEWRNQSVTFHYEVLLPEKGKSGGLRLANCLPPPASTLLAHLKLAKNLRARRTGEPSWVERIAEALLRTEDLSEAVFRLSFLPVILPPAILNSYDALGEQEQSVLLDVLEPRLQTCLGRIHFLHLLLRAKSRGDRHMDRARSVVAWLSSEEGQLAYRLFNAVLSWTTFRLFEAEGGAARRLPSALYLACCWLHAGRLCQALHLGGAITDKLAGKFEAQAVMPVEKLFDFPQPFMQDVCHPVRFSHRKLLLLGVGELLKQVPSVDMEALGWRALADDLALVRPEGLVYPHPRLLENPALLTNELNSFLGVRADSALASLLPADLTNLFSEAQARTSIAAILAGLLEKPDANDGLWTMLMAWVGDLPIYEEFRADLRRLLKHLDAEKLGALKTELQIPVLHFTINQAWHLKDSALIDRCADMIVALARGEAANPGTDAPAGISKKLLELFNTALMLGAGEKQPRSRARRFFKTVHRLLLAWPQVGGLLLQHLEPFTAQSVAGGTSEFWDAMLCARSYAV